MLGGIGQGERVGDSVQALTFDDVTHGLGTVEDAGFFGLLSAGVERMEGIIGKVQFEGPQAGGLHHTGLQK